MRQKKETMLTFAQSDLALQKDSPHSAERSTGSPKSASESPAWLCLRVLRGKTTSFCWHHTQGYNPSHPSEVRNLLRPDSDQWPAQIRHRTRHTEDCLRDPG